MLTVIGLRQFESSGPKDESDDRIFLTFDDGPDPVWTPRVLDALNRLGAKATFFVIAPLALRFPHLVRRMTQSGHAVELHCSNHVRHTELTRAEVEDDARRGLRTLRDLGLLPTLWRTPWGAVTPWTRALANDLGLELVAWTVDTHDWRGDAASQMLARVRPDLQPGSIVLMHDALGPGARREGCEETVTLLEKLVEHARFLGCEPRPIASARQVFNRMTTGERLRPGDRPSTRSRTLDVTSLESVLSRVGHGAAKRDAHPAFPEGPFRELAAAGILAMPAPAPGDVNGKRRASFAEEWDVLRAVARADGSIGRILDGHLNGIERLSVLTPEPLRSREFAAVAAGQLRLGVWGADPVPGEGTPARLVVTEDGYCLEGVKTFCSGATGLDRALVAVRTPAEEPPGLPLLAYIGLSEGMRIDDGWFKASGMRSSESHRVVFEGAPVLAVLGGPGELVREPYFGRDAIRTAVTWAGIADSAVEGALDVLAAKSQGREPDDIVSLAVGRMLASQGTMDRWLEHAASFVDANPEASTACFSTQLREAVAAAARDILDVAAWAVGSHPFATASKLDRARRDLELILLQHRLEPALAQVGKGAIEERKART